MSVSLDILAIHPCTNDYEGLRHVELVFRLLKDLRELTLTKRDRESRKVLTSYVIY